MSGPNFGAASVPSMWRLVRAATRDIKHPMGKRFIRSGRIAHEKKTGEPDLTSAASGTDTAIAEARIGALGSGSDYTPFLQHLGIPAVDMGFGGDYGVYHSAYDSFYWMSNHGDPGFRYHVLAAQLWGTVTMRLADAPGLPFHYRDYAFQIRDYVNESLKTAKRRNLATAFSEKPISEAIEDFAEEAERTEKARREAVAEVENARVEASDRHPRAEARLKRINDALIMVERSLTDCARIARPAMVCPSNLCSGDLHRICCPTFAGFSPGIGGP